jgi:hypothetical protein
MLYLRRRKRGERESFQAKESVKKTNAFSLARNERHSLLD